MKRLGEAVEISEEGLVVEAEFAPGEGDMVVDKKMREVGVVDDVFGSVESPFVVVDSGADEDAVGSVLYVLRKD